MRETTTPMPDPHAPASSSSDTATSALSSLHPDYTPEKKQRAAAKQWGSLFGALAFILSFFPQFIHGLPHPDVVIVSLAGAGILYGLGYQLGYIWASPIVKKAAVKPARPKLQASLPAATEPAENAPVASLEMATQAGSAELPPPVTSEEQLEKEVAASAGEAVATVDAASILTDTEKQSTGTAIPVPSTES
jgi:hypothetical protein